MSITFTNGEQEVWHSGELSIHKLLKVPPFDFPPPNIAGLTASSARFFSSGIEFLSLGYETENNGPLWVSLISSSQGFLDILSAKHVGIETTDLSAHDPIRLIKSGKLDSEKVFPMAGVGVSFLNRNRLKIYGRSTANMVFIDDLSLRMVFEVTGLLPNCPKYIAVRDLKYDNRNRKDEIISNKVPLEQKAIDHILASDCLFMATINGQEMDVNHRGGQPGFIRVSKRGDKVIFPDYSGNRFYQSIGNLYNDPRIGITVPNFENGDILYITGNAKILYGEELLDVMPKARLAIQINIELATFVASAFVQRGPVIEHSMYNPPIMYLNEEIPPIDVENYDISVNRVSSKRITPEITLSTFETERPIKWSPGQHAILDFEEEFSNGYEHMNDGDPQALNDDFIRTFTISSVPLKGTSTRFQIMTRNVGHVTNYLQRAGHITGYLKGIGGDFTFDKNQSVGFIAGGIGITPLLAHLPASNVNLWWGLKQQDLGLIETLDLSSLASVHIFITGTSSKRLDASYPIEGRRLNKSDFKDSEIKSWYVCAPKALVNDVDTWISDLYGLEVKKESFFY